MISMISKAEIKYAVNSNYRHTGLTALFLGKALEKM